MHETQAEQEKHSPHEKGYKQENKGMTLERIEAELEKALNANIETLRTLEKLKLEVRKERELRERVELRLCVKRRGRPSKFLTDIPTLEEQGLIPKTAGATQ